jgi:hypothetical protein
MYLEKKVTAAELEEMRRTGYKVCEHGEYINLKVVPMEDVFGRSRDAKSLDFALSFGGMRREGKLPPAGNSLRLW